jgi:transcription elongation factor Elf1
MLIRFNCPWCGKEVSFSYLKNKMMVKEDQCPACRKPVKFLTTIKISKDIMKNAGCSHL